ncbi:DUF2637 domain-containing protein [Nonomuraea jiangxiensis]|uniref:DUF2637 domain-containing protein n=1 Tax=Nonomuraea jiangxiensis TaxID=633440 RepID=A0A1G8XSE2_9ACTN|nr:DUF2637 domain-containing protein [Nonomuraea jiangxiensis]SDJ93468.1 Protein of unknown function [Nonomuraea jiangxiensis]
MIRWSTTIVVVILAAVAAVVSYRHALEVVAAHGESGLTAYLVPLTIDGLVFASSMVLLDAARRGARRPKLAYFTLALGIAATLAANVLHGIAHGPIGAVVAAWPAAALVLSYELLMGLIRRSAVSDDVKPDIVTNDLGAVDVMNGSKIEVQESVVPVQVEPVRDVKPDIPHHLDEPPVVEVEVQPDLVPEPDADAPYRPVAVATFLAEVAQGEPPTVRTIKDKLNVGTDRARRLQAYLGGLVETSGLANSN